MNANTFIRVNLPSLAATLFRLRLATFGVWKIERAASSKAPKFLPNSVQKNLAFCFLIAYFAR
jgi:hypothetical protein